MEEKLKTEGRVIVMGRIVKGTCIRQALLLMLTLGAAPAFAETTPYSPSMLQWSQLKYHGEKMFLSVNTSVTAEVLTNSVAREELITPAKGPGKAPVADDIVKINVRNDIVGRISDYTVWLEPDTSLLQRTSIYSGNKNRYRVDRFMDAEVFSEKRRPGNDKEEGLDWSKWSRSKQSYDPLEKSKTPLILSRSEALFYLIGTAQLKKKGDQASLNVLDRKGDVKATVKVLGTKKVEVEYDRVDAGKTVHVSKEVNALDAILTVVPLKPSGNLDDFKFLGYKGNIKLAIDPELNTILALSGSIDYVGDVTIQLQEFTLKTP